MTRRSHDPANRMPPHGGRCRPVASADGTCKRPRISTSMPLPVFLLLSLINLPGRANMTLLAESPSIYVGGDRGDNAGDMGPFLCPIPCSASTRVTPPCGDPGGSWPEVHMEAILPLHPGTDARDGCADTPDFCPVDDPWPDRRGGGNARDGICVIAIPVPRTLLLVALGTGLIGWLRIRRVLV